MGSVDYHTPILCDEIMPLLIKNKEGVYFDGTLGGGGHSEAILKNINCNGKLISVDRDMDSIVFSQNRLSDYPNFIPVHSNFHNIDAILDDLNISKIDGALLDLGVSSHQIDSSSRGFSYHINSDLDMRMDRSQGITAKEYLNSVSQYDFEKDLYLYADEKWAKKISEKLIKFRQDKPIETTFDLVSVVDSAIPAKLRYQIKGHPAKRTFQAVRIAINDEIKPLEKSIYDIVNRLNSGARLCIITFHSIEDRIVKHTFKSIENPCICPSKSPICTCNKIPIGKIITKKAIVASEQELLENSRSHSAKLRVLEKL